MTHPLYHRGLVSSLRAALWGLLTTVASQRNMKIHVVSAVLVAIVGMALDLDLASRTALLFSVALVFFAEILNTALEAFVDLHIRDFAHAAMIAKDASAAGVFVLALSTVLVLASILWSSWDLVAASGDAVERSLRFGLPFGCVVAIALWTKPRIWLRLILLAAGGTLGLPLWTYSHDPVFSALLFLLFVLSLLARVRPETVEAATRPG